MFLPQFLLVIEIMGTKQFRLQRLLIIVIDESNSPPLKKVIEMSYEKFKRSPNSFMLSPSINKLLLKKEI